MKNICPTCKKKKLQLLKEMGQSGTPTEEQWREILDGTFIIKKLTHCLRLQERQMEYQWGAGISQEPLQRQAGPGEKWLSGNDVRVYTPNAL